ncbi:MAG: DegV family protein [Clostridia bacterium]|nr:DegV family protein [Clostridia bacterium]
MSIRFITDSASDFVKPHRPEITVIPMSVTFGDTTYLDGVNLTHEKFFELLVESGTLPSTSMITPVDFEEAFKEAVDNGEEVICVTLSSRLSGTWQSACIAAESFGDKVYVVDSENATVGEQILIERGLQLADAGMSAAEIATTLDAEKKNIRLIALLDTLEYLKKGGRLSSSAAFVGGLLGIKPVICIRDGAVCLLGKARGSKNGNNLLMEEVNKTTGIDYSKPLALAYSGFSDKLLQKCITDSAVLWEGKVDSLPIKTIGGTIGTHIGPGAIAVVYFQK